MREIPLTQGKFALVDDIDYEYLMQFNWCAQRNGRQWRTSRNQSLIGRKRTKRRMHQDIADRMNLKYELIDHKDQNPLNNCRSNLRVATMSQNLHNRGRPNNNTTGVKGVCLCKKTGLYRARIKVAGETHDLGRHDTRAEAERVVVAKRNELVGEFACHG